MTMASLPHRRRTVPLVSALVRQLAGVLDRVARTLRRPSVVIVVGEGGLRRLVRRGGRVRSQRAMGWADLEGAAGRRRSRLCEVRLEASRVIDRVVEVPAAGRDHLPAILDLQIERMTPWAADRVAYDHVTLDKGSAAGTVSVRIVAASRTGVEDVVSRLKAAGVRPVCVGTAADPLDRASPVNLLARRAGEGPELLLRASRWILGLLVALTLGAGALSAVRLHAAERAVETLQARLADARGRLDLATRHEGPDDAARRIERRKAAALATVVLVEDLARRLPDGTFLTELSIEDGSLRLAGVSLDASDLIAILEASPILSGARFSASVVRELDGRREQFRIAAVIDPAAAPGDEASRTEQREAAIDPEVPAL